MWYVVSSLVSGITSNYTHDISRDPQSVHISTKNQPSSCVKGDISPDTWAFHEATQITQLSRTACKNTDLLL